MAVVAVVVAGRPYTPIRLTSERRRERRRWRRPLSVGRSVGGAVGSNSGETVRQSLTAASATLSSCFVCSPLARSFVRLRSRSSPPPPEGSPSADRQSSEKEERRRAATVAGNDRDFKMQRDEVRSSGDMQPRKYFPRGRDFPCERRKTEEALLIVMVCFGNLRQGKPRMDANYRQQVL